MDWSFLEGMMLKMGFSEKWVKGVSSLYRTTTSKVMMGGGKGPAFSLSRSVRQGCPMVPYLFLLFAEAMSSFLNADATGLQGLRLSSMLTQLLDSEFADDTALYMKGSVLNLNKLKKALEVFCIGLGAKLNSNKTVGFWIGESATPNWQPHPEFR